MRPELLIMLVFFFMVSAEPKPKPAAFPQPKPKPQWMGLPYYGGSSIFGVGEYGRFGGNRAFPGLFSHGYGESKLNQLIGKTVKEAEAFLMKERIMINGHKIGIVRVVKADGVSWPITADLSYNRVNVELKRNRIVDISCCG